jgi:hypothetical protein
MRTAHKLGHEAGSSRRALVLLIACSLAVGFTLALASGALSDTIKLKNGGSITCKVVKDMDELIKVRMPYRGRIVTTFLSKGAIDSIQTQADMENRKHFQKIGVRNPSRNFEPVYYSGITAAPKGKGAPGALRQGALASLGKGQRKRGIDARRERFDKTSKDRAQSRRGAKAETAPTSQAAAASQSATTSPSTSATATTTSGGGQTTAGITLGSSAQGQ